ncbi:MAG: PLP-dependent transferase [Candidatus Marinimicrobia bacterium]|nr:PLP-dependent transferase [Candidatus Neomarinimicrobiota bacterium]MBT6870517.1 PLP-dependent transferase [Candidatus Neomarinimicrobiota bacterium]
MKKKFETRAIHVGQKPEELYGSVSLPIYQTSTFKQEEFGEYTYDYSRAGNPTRNALEKTIASLEGGADAAMFASGMAAMSAIFTLLKQGDHLILSGNVYGGTYRLLTQIMEDMGLSSSWIDTSDSELVQATVASNTKMIVIESPTNPMMQLTDIEAVSQISKKNNLLLVVDNTFMSPYYQRPLSLGADLVMHSTTKYINGHSDVIGGVVIGSDSEIMDRLHFIQMSVGAVPGPFDCWLTQRALKTLAVRMESHNHNAMRLAEKLEDSGKFKNIYYPGLPSHPQFELATRQQLNPHGKPGYGGMLSVELNSVENARQFVKGLEIFTLAESLGGVESLVCHPATMTHASIPKEIRVELGITDGLIRLSVGIEHVDDLLMDINNALSKVV